jgi:thiamine-monophosphate kinase
MSAAARRVVALEPGIAARLASGGDDYELAFTAAPEAAETIRAIGARLAVAVARIGWIEAGRGVRLVDAAGRELFVEATGYRHF